MLKQIITLALTAVITATPLTAQAKSVNGKSVNGKSSDTLTVRIKGMRCEECAHKVKTVLRKDAGIGGILFNIERRTATIAYDPAVTSADSIYAHLKATGRYKASPYDPNEVIHKGIGLRMDDMHCQKCADRIIERLGKLEGVDSLAPHLDQHRFFIRYDANRTSKKDICALLLKIGYTPVSFYTDKRISYAYYLIPAEAATDETIEQVLAIDGVDDANVSKLRKSLAVTFLNTKITADELLRQIQQAGIKAVLPKPHVCSEEK